MCCKMIKLLCKRITPFKNQFKFDIVVTYNGSISTTTQYFSIKTARFSRLLERFRKISPTSG